MIGRYQGSCGSSLKRLSNLTLAAVITCNKHGRLRLGHGPIRPGRSARLGCAAKPTDAHDRLVSSTHPMCAYPTSKKVEIFNTIKLFRHIGIHQWYPACDLSAGVSKTILDLFAPAAPATQTATDSEGLPAVIRPA